LQKPAGDRSFFNLIGKSTGLLLMAGPSFEWYGDCSSPPGKEADSLDCAQPFIHGRFAMLSWVIIFLVVAIIAAIFGFGGIAAGAASIAQILFYIFLVLFVVSLIMTLAGGRRLTPPPV
jgi:uncharacterized membrane protein YtjA (UPF0391 family)